MSRTKTCNETEKGQEKYPTPGSESQVTQRLVKATLSFLWGEIGLSLKYFYPV